MAANSAFQGRRALDPAARAESAAPRSVVIFDCEYTTWRGALERGWSGPGEHRELVQIGAIRIDADSLAETGRFEALVRPRINPELSSYFTALTGIREGDIARRGLDLSDAFENFRRFIGPARAISYGEDDGVIAANFKLYRARPRGWPLFANIQPWFATQGVPREVNSGRLARHLGVSLTGGSEHDALFDCRSIRAGLAALVARGAPHPFGGSGPAAASRREAAPRALAAAI